MKKLVEKSVEGAGVLELCLEGDKLLEEGTGAVYNKAVKGVKVPKGASQEKVFQTSDNLKRPENESRYLFPNLHLCQQLCCAFLSARVRSFDPSS